MYSMYILKFKEMGKQVRGRGSTTPSRTWFHSQTPAGTATPKHLLSCHFNNAKHTMTASRTRSSYKQPRGISPAPAPLRLFPCLNHSLSVPRGPAFSRLHRRGSPSPGTPAMSGRDATLVWSVQARIVYKVQKSLTSSVRHGMVWCGAAALSHMWVVIVVVVASRMLFSRVVLLLIRLSGYTYVISKYIAHISSSMLSCDWTAAVPHA